MDAFELFTKKESHYYFFSIICEEYFHFQAKLQFHQLHWRAAINPTRQTMTVKDQNKVLAQFHCVLSPEWMHHFR